MSAHYSQKSSIVCNSVDCGLTVVQVSPESLPKQAQKIDYMAKDYDSFLRAMLDLLQVRVPGWKDRSEADLGMVVLELFAYMGDQLSYYQDRVANEAFLHSASQFESVKKLLQLIDYQIHPGATPRVLLIFDVVGSATEKYLPAGFCVVSPSLTGEPSQSYQTDQSVVLYSVLNKLVLYSPLAVGAALMELDAVLDVEMLPIGTWLYIVDEIGGTWVRVTQPISNDGVKTTVPIDPSIKYSYPAGTEVNGNTVLASYGKTHQTRVTVSDSNIRKIELDFAPLTYVEGSNGEPVSSLHVEADSQIWQEVDDFTTSTAVDFHFRVSKDNLGYASVNFGDGRNGRVPPIGSSIEIHYRSGIGEQGNVAANTLTGFQDSSGDIVSVNNPQASFGARNPETMEQAKQQGSGQLSRQNRAVTPADYEQILLAGVNLGTTFVAPLHAKARFQWTGSWITVYLSVEMPNRQSMDHPTQHAFEQKIRNKKMVGYDFCLQAPRYAPLHIGLVINVKAEFFARIVRLQVEQLLSSNTNENGSVGYFSPLKIGFGKKIHLSDLYAVITSVEGVSSVSVSRFKRLGNRFPDCENVGYIEIDPYEIARCDNDPEHPELGILFVQTCGGKNG